MEYAQGAAAYVDPSWRNGTCPISLPRDSGIAVDIGELIDLQ